jgi:hypothetical protein
VFIRSFNLNKWLGYLDSNQGMTESKSVALPLGYSPMKMLRATPANTLNESAHQDFLYVVLLYLTEFTSQDKENLTFQLLI